MFVLKKKSVLHILTSHAWGGLELYVIQLVKKLFDDGVKVALYCIEGSKVDIESRKLNIPIFYAHKHSRFSISDIIKVRKIIRNEHFEIIHTHTRIDVWLGSLIKMSSNIEKHIFSLYMSAPSKKDIIHRFIYNKVDAITSSSEILNESIKLNYPIPPHKVHLLRYGRNQENFEKNKEDSLSIRELWNTKETDIVFATMCRLDSAKGVREFAESLLFVPKEIKEKIKIWIIGERTLLYTDHDGMPVYENQSNELYEWLKNYILVKDAGESKPIELIPFQQNIVPYLNAIDVFVLATYKETYSLSVLDAMGAGIPIIGTDSGGTAEQIKHGERGLKIEPKSAQAIAEAIITYVKNPENIKIHGKAAKQWVRQEHDWFKTLNKLQQIYHL